jgi:hypothetical protein
MQRGVGGAEHGKVSPVTETKRSPGLLEKDCLSAMPVSESEKWPILISAWRVVFSGFTPCRATGAPQDRALEHLIFGEVLPRSVSLQGHTTRDFRKSLPWSLGKPRWDSLDSIRTKAR